MVGVGRGVVTPLLTRGIGGWEPAAAVSLLLSRPACERSSWRRWRGHMPIVTKPPRRRRRDAGRYSTGPKTPPSVSPRLNTRVCSTRKKKRHRCTVFLLSSLQNNFLYFVLYDLRFHEYFLKNFLLKILSSWLISAFLFYFTMSVYRSRTHLIFANESFQNIE